MEIVLIEDGLMDARMAVSSIQRCGIHHRLTLLRDGEAAIRFLKRDGIYRQAPVPDVVMLDLFLPGADGFEVLSFMKATDELKSIPVVVLTSSDEPEDQQRAEAAEVQHFIIKPFNEDKFLSVLRALQNQSLLKDFKYTTQPVANV